MPQTILTIGIKLSITGGAQGGGSSGPPGAGGIEFETDHASFLLLEDGISFLLLEV